MTATIFNHLAAMTRYKNYRLSDGPKGQRDLFMAAMTGDLWAIERTIAKTPEAAKWKDTQGMTALMFAAREGRGEVVKFLIPLSDLNAKTEFGYDALKFAKGTPRSAPHPDIATEIQRALNGQATKGSPKYG